MTKKAKGSRRHAEVEILSFGGITARMGPVGLIVYADHYLSAAKATKAPENAANFPLVRTFLACRAVELALKAFLSLKETSLVQLADGPFGHDLKNLVEQAEKLELNHLVKLSDSQRNEVIRASTYYRDKVLEYPAITEAIRAYPGMPNANVLIEAAELLVLALREPCLAA